MGKKKLLFFSDFGVDDILAVLYAFFSTKIDMVGIVVDYGNISKENALRNVRFLKKLTGKENIPAFGGAAVPLTGKSPTYYPDIHGPAGLGPIVPSPDMFTFDFENFYEINSLIKKYENEIILFCSGRLSSLATMFILYPEMMKKVKDIYIMGGAFHSPGNVTPKAEANFYSDPYAVNLILEQSPIKTHIVPLDVTSHAILTPQMVNDLDRYYRLTNNQVGMIIKPMVDFYYRFYKSRSPQIEGSPMHDLLALWSLENREKIVFEPVPVRILVEEGEGFGQSLGDFRNILMKASWPVHYVAKEFDYSQFISQVIQTFKSIPINHEH